jgi:hypothetical protein
MKNVRGTAKNAGRQSGELRIQGFSEAKRERKIRRIPRGGLSIFLACLFCLLFLTKKKSKNNILRRHFHFNFSVLDFFFFN